MNSITEWHNRVLGEKVVENLKENGFDAVYFKSNEDVAEYILKFVEDSDKVGFGGSITIKELGIKDKIKELGAIILDHGDSSLSPQEKKEVKRAQLVSDLFLCSSNAITMNGYLINVDGAGNRVAAITFGPKKVIIVAGINKICKDEEAAMERIKIYAAPKNSKRLGLNTPCCENGICSDCKSKNRICRIYSIIKRKPMDADITVVIVGEKLGF